MVEEKHEGGAESPGKIGLKLAYVVLHLALKDLFETRL